MQEGEKEKEEWKWEKVAAWRAREDPPREYAKTQLLSPPPPFLPSYIPEILASFHTGVITALSSFFSSSPFRVGFSLFFSSLLLLSLKYLVSRIYVELRLLPTRGGGGRTVTSTADFMLECSHLESVFSCMESIDIYSQQAKKFLQSFSQFYDKPKNCLVDFFI